MEKKTRISKKPKDLEKLKELKKLFGKQWDQSIKEVETISLNLKKESRNAYIKRKIDEYLAELQRVPSGIYQEPDQPKILHQQKFLEILKDTSPHLINELKPLIKNFKIVFGENSSINSINQILQKLTELENLLYELRFPHTASTSNISDDFIWKRYKIPFLAIKFGLNFPNLNNVNLEILPDSLLTWINEYREWNFSPQYETPDQIYQIVNSTFKNITSNNDSLFESFIDLQSSIYLWMEKHNLERDFIFMNVYYFLSQLSQNESIPTVDLKILGRWFYKKLEGDEFDSFKAEGWWAGGERAEDYKKRVIKEFKVALDNYILKSYNDLELQNKTHVTRPIDPDLECVYWLIAWNDGANYKQIARCFNKTFDTVKSGIKKLRYFDLPRRIDKPGRKKKPLIDNHRIEIIRNHLLQLTNNIKRKG